jgi:two-component system NtrC family sensor kinase
MPGPCARLGAPLEILHIGSNMNERRYFNSLTKKMALIVILVSLTPLTLITGLMGYYFETYYREKILENLQESLKSHQQHINWYLDKTLSDVEFLASSSSYDELSSNAYLQNELRMLRNAYPHVFVDLGLVNTAGVQISYAGDLNLIDANYSQADWFREAVKKDYYLSDVFLGLRRKPHFVICVKTKRAGSYWLLRATVSFADFNSLVDEIRVGETGSAFIVNNKGEFQSQPRTELISNIRGLLRITPWVGGNEGPATETATLHVPEAKVISSRNSALTGTVKSRSENVLFILMPLKSGEWTLVYQQQWNDAFSEINRARATALTIFFAGCLAVLLAAFLISRKAVGQIERAEFEKEKMNAQVTEALKLASIGELAAGVAHEINNPVAIMLEQAGWMEDLLEEEGLQKSEILDEFKHSLKQISLQGIRCKEITHKLLSFARSTDRFHTKIQLNDTIRETLNVVCTGSSKLDGITIHTDLDRELPPVLASQTEMEEVFMNLINNAIDAMSSAGGSLRIQSRVEGKEVVVDVEDTGHGMPETVLARVFDPFFTTKPAGQGTGLGLSICYGIIKKLGGSLTAESTVGIGTTFHIRVPIGTETARVQ